MTWPIPNRTYGAINARQQRADRLVFTQDELIRVLAEAALGHVAVIRLGAVIYLTTPAVFGAFTYDVVIDGGGKFGFSCAATATEMLSFAASPSNITFRDLFFERTGTKLTRLIAVAGGLINGINFERVRLIKIERIFEFTNGTGKWRRSTFNDVQINQLALTDSSEVGTAQFEQCYFIRCYAYLPSNTVRRLTITDVVGSTRNVAIEAGPLTSTSGVSLNSFDAARVYRMNITDALTTAIIATPSDTLTISAAAPTVVPTATIMRLTIVAGASGNATIADGQYDGQRLILNTASISGGGTFTLPNSTLNNVRIGATWAPITAHQNICMWWNAADSNWHKEGL